MNQINLQNDICLPIQGAFFVTFVFVLLAEMGDKSQLLVIALTTRYKLRQVFLGVVLSIIALNTLAVFMGSIVTSLIPMLYIQTFASVVFIILGILSFENSDEDVEKDNNFKFIPTLTVFITFFIAELGDKTQLATMVLAAKYNAPIKVLIAAVLGMIIADLIGVVAGATLNKFLPQKYIKMLGGVIFIGFGIFGLTCLIPLEQLSVIKNSIAIVLGGVAVIALLLIILKGKK